MKTKFLLYFITILINIKEALLEKIMCSTDPDDYCDVGECCGPNFCCSGITKCHNGECVKTKEEDEELFSTTSLIVLGGILFSFLLFILGVVCYCVRKRN